MSVDRFLDRFGVMTPAQKDQIYREIVSRCQLVGDCWVYPVVNSKGYGCKRVGEKVIITSRFVQAYVTRESYNLKRDACHIGDCSYRACCNPRHLDWGTHRENALQREQKEREGRYDPRWAVDPLLGYETHEKHSLGLRGKGVDVHGSTLFDPCLQQVISQMHANHAVFDVVTQ